MRLGTKRQIGSYSELIVSILGSRIPASLSGPEKREYRNEVST